MKEKFVTCYGAKQYRIDDYTDPKNQPSQNSKFIGRATGEFSTTESWLTDKAVNVKQLLKVMKAANAHKMTTIQDLPSIQPRKLGRGLVIKNPKDLYNPQKLYLMLEKGDYAFRNPQWMKYFPAFESALDAHRDMHVLLGISYKMQLQINPKLEGSQEEEEVKQMSFVPGQLVLVKCKKEGEEKLDASISYELRRGFIENVGKEPGTTRHFIYTVYMLDFGFSVEVTRNFVSPLPHPFDTIAPLATECSLYGVSPVGANWDYHTKEDFSNLLRKYSDHVFIVDVLSDHRILPIINIDICDYEVRVIKGHRKIKAIFRLNLTQFLIDSQRGVQWNLFPSRPKLMAGVTPASPEALYGPQKLPRVTISYRDALLIAPVTLPILHKHLPLKVISRELKKLFRLRHNHLVDVLGTKNYLAIEIPDPDNFFRTPSTINPTPGNENGDDDDDN